MGKKTKKGVKGAAKSIGKATHRNSKSGTEAKDDTNPEVLEVLKDDGEVTKIKIKEGDNVKEEEVRILNHRESFKH